VKWFLLCAIAALLTSGDCYPGGGQQVTKFADSTFVRAQALAVDQYNQVFVLDAGTSQVLKLSAPGEVSAHVGGYGWTGLSLDQPSDVTTINGLDVFVADYGNHRIQRFDRNLSLISSFPTGAEESSPRSFGYPRSAAEGPGGALYVTDGENNRMLRIDLDGTLRFFGGLDASAGKLHHPGRVRINSDELVFVQDSNMVVTYDRFGNYVRTFGPGLFRDLKAFTFDRDTMYALDSCSLLRISERGGLIDSCRDVCLFLNDPPPQVVDVAIQGGTCYLLTLHELYIVEIDRLFNSRQRRD